MARMGGYERKGGTSANAGRTAKMLTDPISGAKVRAFHDQRRLSVIQKSVVQKGDAGRMLVMAHASEVEAHAHLDSVCARMTHDRLQWARMSGRREFFPGLPTDPPADRPDIGYVIEAV